MIGLRRRPARRQLPRGPDPAANRSNGACVRARVGSTGRSTMPTLTTPHREPEWLTASPATRAAKAARHHRPQSQRLSAPSAARATATSARWSKARATSTSAASASSSASRSSTRNGAAAASRKTLFTDIPTPREIKEQARPVRHRPGARQEGPLRRRPQPLQAAEPRRRGRLATSRSTRSTSCSSARPAAARRCWPARWPGSSTCRSPSATPPR